MGKPKVRLDFTDDCDNCLCSVPRSYGMADLRTRAKPFWCGHPSLVEARKVQNKDAFGARPEWCPLDKGENVLIMLRPKNGTTDADMGQD